ARGERAARGGAGRRRSPRGGGDPRTPLRERKPRQPARRARAGLPRSRRSGATCAGSTPGAVIERRRDQPPGPRTWLEQKEPPPMTRPSRCIPFHPRRTLDLFSFAAFWLGVSSLGACTARLEVTDDNVGGASAAGDGGSEIGRASCREREARGGGGGSIERERTRESSHRERA